MNDSVSRPMRRSKGNYFQRLPDAPLPLSASVRLRAAFGAVDAMAVVWHGRYSQYCEEAYAALTRSCGISYHDFFMAQLRAPVVQVHLDYFESLRLEEEFVVTARLVWCEGARMNVEYMITKIDGVIAATGYTVHMFTDPASGPLLIVPPLIETLRRRWQQGDFACLMS
ncbi:MAG: acyl-CoA thioesterase [Candidatus Omnitrophica bacterium]|nr:acyl-CoA thioesterase [Candidatus Omnitrophota bacterium]